MFVRHYGYARCARDEAVYAPQQPLLIGLGLRSGLGLLHTVYITYIYVQSTRVAHTKPQP